MNLYELQQTLGIDSYEKKGRLSELEVSAVGSLKLLLSLHSSGGTEENYNNLRVAGTSTWDFVNTRKLALVLGSMNCKVIWRCCFDFM